MNSDSQQQASIATNQFGDTYIDILNHTHFQTHSAAQIYTRIFLEKLSESKTLYVIIGTDSGLFPKYLSKFPTPEGTQYLFIELDLVQPVIDELLANETQVKHPIFSPSNWEQELTKLELNKYIYDDKVKVIKSLAATEGNIEDYIDLFQKVKIRLNSINHELIATTAQIDHIKNRIINAIDNIKSFTELENTATGPALILAAGPSLNQHLDWIKSHQDKFTIIVVSRIYQLLKQSDIHPDIVVSIDPQEINYQNSKAMLDSDDFIFVHSNHVSPQLLAQWNGISFFCGPLLPWKTDEKLENQQHTGPTVTHFALTIASAMGFNDIYLAGVDFCFEASGISHADGSALPVDKEEAPTVTTYGGETAYTNFFFENSVKYLGEIASKHKGHIYNLSKNAAQVNGISYKEYPEISGDKWQKPDFRKITKNQRLNHIKNIKNEFIKAKKNFLEIEKLSNTALILNDEILDNRNGNLNQSKQLKLDKIDKQLNTKFKHHVQVALLVVSRDFMRLLNENTNNRTAEQEHKWLNDYYTAYSNGANVISRIIEAAKRSVESRIEEFSPNPDIESLIKYWTQHKIEGRSCSWKQHHWINNSDELQKRRLDDLCNIFLEDIRENISKTNKLITFLENYYSTTTLLYSSKDNEGLEKLLTKICNLSQSRSQFICFKLLLEGLIAQNNNETNKALEAYQKIIDEINPNEIHFLLYLRQKLIAIMLHSLTEINSMLMTDYIIMLYEAIESRQEYSDRGDKIRHVVWEQIMPFLLKNVHTLYINSNITAAEKLMNSIFSTFPQKERFGELKHFLKGIREQLDNNIELAKEHYSHALNIAVPNFEKETTQTNKAFIQSLLNQMLTISDNKESSHINAILAKINI